MEDLMYSEGLFKPEAYKGRVIDIVHEASLNKVVGGQKPSDITTIQDAKRMLARLAQLRDPSLGVIIRSIENPGIFEPIHAQIPLLGGAFDGQCLKDYQSAALKHNVVLKPDPHLTLRLD